MAVNVRTGVFLCAKHCIPDAGTGGGAIVVIASDSSYVATLANQAVYCASKGAVLMLTRALAVDRAQDNIRVNCVCPSVVDTPMVRNIFQAGDRISPISDCRRCTRQSRLRRSCSSLPPTSQLAFAVRRWSLTSAAWRNRRSPSSHDGHNPPRGRPAGCPLYAAPRLPCRAVERLRCVLLPPCPSRLRGP